MNAFTISKLNFQKKREYCGLGFSSVQSLSCVWLFATPWIAARQASLSITNSRSLLKLMSIESVMPSNHLILCRPLLLPPSIFPSIRVFSNELVLHIRWPKYWSFNFSISPSNEYSGLISFRIDWLDRAVPWTVICQAPLSIGFSRWEYWSGLPFPSPRELPKPGIEPRSPILQADALPTELWGKAPGRGLWRVIF